jgi:hypothetical protein
MHQFNQHMAGATYNQRSHLPGLHVSDHGQHQSAASQLQDCPIKQRNKNYNMPSIPTTQKLAVGVNRARQPKIM